MDNNAAYADWNKLSESKSDTAVPVALFALCKAVVEDDQGALFLHATLVQRVVVDNVPAEATLVQRVLVDNVPAKNTPRANLEKLLFTIKVKGPLSGGYVEDRRIEIAKYAGSETKLLCSKTLELISAPLDARQLPLRSSFGILEATVDLELQATKIDFGKGQGQVWFCPDLLHPSLHASTTGTERERKGRQDRIVKVQEPLATTRPSLSRMRRLNLLNEVPVVEMFGDIRTKGHSLVTYPQMRLKFWLDEPTTTTVYNVVGPLVLVVALMLMNYEEFFGFSFAFSVMRGNEECVEADETSETYRTFFTNGIGIALAAFFVIPAFSGEATSSPLIRFHVDHTIAMVFLLGLVLSNFPHCLVALAGCGLSCLVVLYGILLCVLHERECTKKKKEAAIDFFVQHTPETKPTAADFDWEQWSRKRD